MLDNYVHRLGTCKQGLLAHTLEAYRSEQLALPVQAGYTQAVGSTQEAGNTQEDNTQEACSTQEAGNKLGENSACYQALARH